MKCPRCAGVNLNLAERQGVEIDFCPECRGIWLDRGEMEKIIERSYAQPPPPYYPEQQAPYGEYRPQHYEERHHDDHDSHHNKPYRRKSWLAEIFD
jgi:uncharacterized protein